MKAFLLAGGYGTRLRPLTDSVPKCLLPIQGNPLLDIWLELCARSGITEVLINLHAHGQVVEKHLTGKSSPVMVRVVHEEQLLGSAGTIAANQSWIASDPAFWILYADVLTTTDLRRMTEYHFFHGAVATVGLYQVPDPSRCGVALTDSAGIITGFEEKPKNPRSNWVFSGLLLAGPRFLDFIPPGTPADIAFDVLPCLLGQLQAYHIHEYLLDIGIMPNYRKAQNTWPGLDVLSVQTREAISTPWPGALSVPQPRKLSGGSS
ncbi:MAG: nucleotidyltransferase family protein [Candidatus Sulfotelmatobacter sp.]